MAEFATPEIPDINDNNPKTPNKTVRRRAFLKGMLGLGLVGAEVSTAAAIRVQQDSAEVSLSRI